MHASRGVLVDTCNAVAEHDVKRGVAEEAKAGLGGNAGDSMVGRSGILRCGEREETIRVS
jgi:hypothetical protein